MTPARVTADLLRARPLPPPEAQSDKNSRGRVAIAGGSATSVGGAMLAALAAFRAGAGKVLLAVPRSLAGGVGVAFPEAGVHGFTDTPAADPVPGPAAREIATLFAQAHAALLGPGLADEQAAQQLARHVLNRVEGPALVIDALALHGLWTQRDAIARHAGRLVITPHAGEMARLMGVAREEIEADPGRAAATAAAHLGCLVVLKGADTVIATAEGEQYLHEGGSAGLATSGSGDVLAGVLAALMARGATAIDAALWSVYLHAQAGAALAKRIGAVGFLARELPGEIPALMQALPRST